MYKEQRTIINHNDHKQLILLVTIYKFHRFIEKQFQILN